MGERLIDGFERTILHGLARSVRISKDRAISVLVCSREPAVEGRAEVKQLNVELDIEVKQALTASTMVFLVAA